MMIAGYCNGKVLIDTGYLHLNWLSNKREIDCWTQCKTIFFCAEAKHIVDIQRYFHVHLGNFLRKLSTGLLHSGKGQFSFGAKIFILWGFMKEKLLPKESALLTEPRTMAVQIYWEIIADMCCHMLMNRKELFFESSTAEEQPYCTCTPLRTNLHVLVLVCTCKPEPLCDDYSSVKSLNMGWFNMPSCINDCKTSSY